MCVILYLSNIRGRKILAKNRDRNYKPDIVIVHEIINGTEVAYIRDLRSEWIEGLNELGYGIVNSSLQVEYDENALSSNILDKKEKLISQSKYLRAISSKSINEFQDSIFDKDYYTDISLQGHTIIANPFYGVHIESKTDGLPIIKALNGKDVFSNHGINIKNTGYQRNSKYISSVLRQNLIKAEVEKTDIKSYQDIFNIMNKNYLDIDEFYQPYRKTKDMYTTSQLILDLTGRKLVFNYDKDDCNFKGIINRLPKNYKPKIQILINKTSKNIDKHPILLNRSRVDNFISDHLL